MNNIKPWQYAAIIILILILILLGVSLSYAFYTATIKGNANLSESTAAVFNVSTNLDSTSTINTTNFNLIDPTSYEINAEKVSFTVNNASTSNVNAKYTLSINNIAMSENLFSQYFKWVLKIKHSNGTADTVINGNFADSTMAQEGNTSTTLTSNYSKVLISDENPITLGINSTDTVTLYLYLENNNNVIQNYLTNGSFSGKLAINIVPTKEGLAS